MNAITKLLTEALPEYPVILFELCATAAAVAVVLLAARGGAARASWLRVAERRFAVLARRRALSVVLVVVFALALRAALLPVLPVPEPVVHDEFSYLLAGDTFAAGRLTNPTHPLWRHFETFHVLHVPSYASKYPAAQGLFLAAGQKLFGHPWAGVWLSVGLMCGAVCWMLQGWLPPRWALAGGLLAALRLGVFTGWINGYMGGAAAAVGGALLLGAWPRLRRRQRARDAALLGLGLLLLANSRPFEGFALSLPVGVALLFWLTREWRRGRIALGRVVAPLALVLAAGACLMGLYFSRVTGSALRMPYMAYHEAYHPVPLFLWQRAGRLPEFRHKAMRDFGAWEIESFERAATPRATVVKVLGKVVRPWAFFVGPALTPPLLFAPLLWRDRRLRLLLWSGGAILCAVLLETWFGVQYAAPATALVFALVLQSMRRLYVWRRRRGAAGRLLALALAAVCLIVFAARVAYEPLRLAAASSAPADSFGLRRARVQRRLEAEPGQHLVVVRYADDHEPGDEWVYNRADINAARVVWAREMTAAENRELLGYFRDRRAWLLEADADPPRLVPYPTAVAGEATQPAP